MQSFFCKSTKGLIDFMTEFNIYLLYGNSHFITNYFIIIFLSNKILTLLSDYLTVNDSKNIDISKFYHIYSEIVQMHAVHTMTL